MSPYLFRERQNIDMTPAAKVLTSRSHAYLSLTSYNVRMKLSGQLTSAFGIVTENAEEHYLGDQKITENLRCFMSNQPDPTHTWPDKLSLICTDIRSSNEQAPLPDDVLMLRGCLLDFHSTSGLIQGESENMLVLNNPKAKPTKKLAQFYTPLSSMSAVSPHVEFSKRSIYLYEGLNNHWKREVWLHPENKDWRQITWLESRGYDRPWHEKRRGRKKQYMRIDAVEKGYLAVSSTSDLGFADMGFILDTVSDYNGFEPEANSDNAGSYSFEVQGVLTVFREEDSAGDSEEVVDMDLVND